ncbi:MAG: mevalonate kinase family protein [Planctomycetota bacterium]|jgi:glucuronokinase
MLLIRRNACARAGLIGNPSDGYHGKTISMIVRNFQAEVTLYEWDDVEIVWSQEDRSRFRSVEELVRDVKLHGYYGGIRLVKATIKKFVEYCRRQELSLHPRNFSVRYHTNIPRQVGLAGSSAIIVATLRCLTAFYEVEIPLRVQPSLVLSVEREELGIAAGLQDRVIQIYEGLVYMDFNRRRMEEVGGFPCGVYEPLDPSLLPPMYIAYSTDVSEPTEVIHNDLRARYDRGDTEVVEAMDRFAELAAEARRSLLDNDVERLATLIDANFDLRRSICRLPREHEQMIERARRVGVPAKFAGSGGAIIGTCPDEATFRRLKEELGAIRCDVIRPVVERES